MLGTNIMQLKRAEGTLSFCRAFSGPSVPGPLYKVSPNHDRAVLTGATRPAIVRAQLPTRDRSLVRRPEKRPELCHDRPRTRRLMSSMVGLQRERPYRLFVALLEVNSSI
jgi:hypothetical protein